MVKTFLAFEFSKTRAICDAFDEAWAFLQRLGSNDAQTPKSLATQTILAKRIMEMADQGLRDIPELRDDAIAFLQHSPPACADRNGLGSGRTIGAKSLAEQKAKRLRQLKCERGAASPGHSGLMDSAPGNPHRASPHRRHIGLIPAGGGLPTGRVAG